MSGIDGFEILEQLDLVLWQCGTTYTVGPLVSSSQDYRETITSSLVSACPDSTIKSVLVKELLVSPTIIVALPEADTPEYPNIPQFRNATSPAIAREQKNASNSARLMSKAVDPTIMSVRSAHSDPHV